MELLTIGYEGLTLEAFFHRLKTGRVEVIVDVRQLPLSRKKGFSKNALATAACQNGFQYVHLKEFGCPKPIRDAYKQDGDWAKYTRDFLSYLATQDLAIARLARQASSARCCLLCFEADPDFCHRSFVAARVSQLTHGEVSVVHLGDDTVTSPIPVAA